MIDIRQINIHDNGRCTPRFGLTPEEWKEEFAIRKAVTSPKGTYKLNFTSSSVNRENSEKYKGDTSYQGYSTFIKEVVKVLKRGETDYVFFTYQITDLIKYFGDVLECNYLPDYKCFEVYIHR